MTATPKISIAPGYEPAEVDLWGQAYETVPATRSVCRKAAALEREAEQTDGGDDDSVVKLYADLVDLRLVPKGHKTKPSTVITAKWKAEELTVAQLTRFLAKLGETNG